MGFGIQEVVCLAGVREGVWEVLWGLSKGIWEGSKRESGGLSEDLGVMVQEGLGSV